MSYALYGSGALFECFISTATITEGRISQVLDTGDGDGGRGVVSPTDLGLGELFFAARDALVVGDAESGRIVLWNEAACRIFGYTEEEAVGRPIEDLIPERLRPHHRAGLRRFVETGTGALLSSHTVADLVGVHSSGHELDIELTLSPLTATDPTSHYALAVIRDVSERRRAQRELQALNESLRDFVAIVAHDMRNPLSVIVGMSSLLSGEAPVPDGDRSRMLKAIERNARTLSRFVDDLLTVSKLEAGALDVRPVPTPLLRIAERIVTELPDPTTVSTGGDGSLMAVADPNHLERVLRNYLTNAVTYGGAPIHVDVRRVGRDAVVVVRDHGPGVPDDLAGRLFEKFARSTQSREKGGTGLGLSIVKGLARANGGDAWYEPGHPVGSCFAVRFPAHNATAGS